MNTIDKIVVITRKTALEELVERFNTREQARFYLEHMGLSFADYEETHDTYRRALSTLRAMLPAGLRCQFVERSYLPNFVFGETDLALTLGPDGLVVNTAKYLSEQPLFAVNPDPRRIDGILAEFSLAEVPCQLAAILHGFYRTERVTMAKATLNDGQTLYAVNDLFIGQRTHVSARYHLRFRDLSENQSSSGIIVSTGAGSTGWHRSLLTGAVGLVSDHVMDISEEKGIAERLTGLRGNYAFPRDAGELCFTVREPFISRSSTAQRISGRIAENEALEITSQMPQNGVIFSDGIEEDYLNFNSGAVARIQVGERRVHLVARPQKSGGKR